MDALSILGGVTLGADTSGYFRGNLHGIAVRRDDRFFALDSKGGHLIDVTESSFDSPFVRLPTSVAKLRAKKDVIITADNPTKAVFVLEINEGVVKGIDVRTSELVDYLPSENLFFKGRFVTKVSGLLDSEGTDLLPLFLLLGGGQAAGGNDGLMQLLLLRSLRDKASGLDDILPFLLLGGGSTGGNSDFLTQVLLIRSLRDKKQEKGPSSELDDLLPFLLLRANQFPAGANQPSAGNPFAGLAGNQPTGNDTLQNFLLTVGKV